MDWQPSASREQLAARAALFAKIRSFFAERDILEVDTPLLCSAGVTDPAIEPLMVVSGQSVTSSRYLQSSPEYAMKRLLAAGSGPIYQLGKAYTLSALEPTAFRERVFEAAVPVQSTKTRGRGFVDGVLSSRGEDDQDRPSVTSGEVDWREARHLLNGRLERIGAREVAAEDESTALGTVGRLREDAVVVICASTSLQRADAGTCAASVGRRAIKRARCGGCTAASGAGGP